MGIVDGLSSPAGRAHNLRAHATPSPRTTRPARLAEAARTTVPYQARPLTRMGPRCPGTSSQGRAFADDELMIDLPLVSSRLAGLPREARGYPVSAENGRVRAKPQLALQLLPTRADPGPGPTSSDGLTVDDHVIPQELANGPSGGVSILRAWENLSTSRAGPTMIRTRDGAQAVPGPGRGSVREWSDPCDEESPGDESPGSPPQKEFCGPALEYAVPLTVYAGAECSTLGWSYGAAPWHAEGLDADQEGARTENAALPTGELETFGRDRCPRDFATERGRDAHRRQSHPEG